MENHIVNLLTKQLPYQLSQIKAVLSLLEEGNTIPFIARYRKEKTGHLDEVAIANIDNSYRKECDLLARKEAVIKAIEAQNQLTPSLKEAISAATALNEVEELYRPYKQKRKTKATKAREAGLGPLAKKVYDNQKNIIEESQSFISEVYPTKEAVFEGVVELIAEGISNDVELRQYLKEQFQKHGQLFSRKKKNAEDSQQQFQMYYEFSSPLSQLVSHRVLALNRGEKEKILTVTIEVNEEKLLQNIKRRYFKQRYYKDNFLILEQASKEALSRFLIPAMQRECRKALTDMAEAQAIKVFGDNLRQLLLQAPLKGKVVMGFDPAYRTGCKLAIVDATGDLLTTEVIYPTTSDNKKREAKNILLQLIDRYDVDIIAIGNGTASRESEMFVSEALKETKRDVSYTIVSEAGASVYSASELAREEFPELPVEKRSAISIARRIQDPLSELIKIDPKSVGVGQYQHDVNQKVLAQQLDFVVDTAVNQVGVNLNTASKSLLTHISGISSTIANNIVTYRLENGAFTSREQLKSVKRLGAKTYEQAVGFLRLPEGDNPLDNTDIHPESYLLAEKLLKKLAIPMNQLEKMDSLSLSQEDYVRYAKDLETTPLMIQELLEALQKRGRDLRESMPQPQLRQDVLSLDDLKPGMELQGTVRNVVDFGAFVDIGVKQDGLVHLSKMARRFIKHPSEVVAVGDIITVWVESVDKERGKIALTMIQ